MNKINALLSIALLTACTSAAEPKPDPKPDEPRPAEPVALTSDQVLATWRGAWDMMLVEGGDKTLLAEGTIAGAELTFTPEGQESAFVFHMTLHPFELPAAIDVRTKDEAEPILGRYLVQGVGASRRLIFCFPRRETDPRPDEVLPCDLKTQVRMELTATQPQ